MSYSDNEISKELVGAKMDITAIKISVEYIKEKLEKNDRREQDMHQLTSTVVKLSNTIEQLAEKTTAEVEHIKTSIKRAGERLERLEQEPATKWKNMTQQIIGVIVSGVIGAMIAAVILLLKNGG